MNSRSVRGLLSHWPEWNGGGCGAGRGRADGLPAYAIASTTPKGRTHVRNWEDDPWGGLSTEKDGDSGAPRHIRPDLNQNISQSQRDVRIL